MSAVTTDSEVRKWWGSLDREQRLEWHNLKGEIKEGDEEFRKNHQLRSTLMPANSLGNIFGAMGQREQ